MRLAILAVPFVIAAGAAQAQDRPPLAPTRDVAVTYKTVGPQGGQTLQMSHAAASGLMRIDTPEMGGFAIVDRNRKRSTMVMTQMRMYMEMNAEEGPMAPHVGADENARFARKGTATVAGLSCTLWEISNPKGDGGTGCITDDSVMLRFLTRNGEGLEATKVTYAPIPAASFAVPAGFQKMDMPAMGGMGGPGGPGGPRPR